MEKIKVEITNPLLFMQKSFMENILKAKYSKATFEINQLNGIPINIMITFPKESQAASFISDFHGKTFDKTVKYSIIIKPFQGNQSIGEKIIKGETITFPIVYEELPFTKYKNSHKYAGLVLKDKDMSDRLSKAVNWLIKRIGANLSKGESIMNISLPVIIFDKRTMLQVFAYELRLAPYFLQRAFYTESVIDKLKWVTSFIISQLHMSAIISKPFSPIIGETFQAKIANMNIYLEQTVSKPLTANFYCYDDEQTYKYYGYIETIAKTGANSVKAIKTGKITLVFKDLSKYEIHLPGVWVGGSTFGKRLFNYKHYLVINDVANHYISYAKFNPDKKGFITGFFASQKTNPDTFIGNIIKSNDCKISSTSPKHTIAKDAKSFGAITGGWTKDLIIDKVTFWKQSEWELFPIMKMNYVLPSDSTQRDDLIAFSKGNEELAQEKKEKIEEIQRRDRKLRGKSTEEDLAKEEEKEKEKNAIKTTLSCKSTEETKKGTTEEIESIINKAKTIDCIEKDNEKDKENDKEN